MLFYYVLVGNFHESAFCLVNPDLESQNIADSFLTLVTAARVVVETEKTQEWDGESELERVDKGFIL